jgi:hypothetical protein
MTREMKAEGLEGWKAERGQEAARQVSFSLDPGNSS